MSNASDFIIENGVLTKYVGSGGDVVVPDGVTSIGSEAFEGCTSLTSITIPDSVTKIGGWAFSRCKSLRSITIPDSVTEIGRRAFENCNSLADNDGFVIVRGVVYDYCGTSKSITIPDGVKKIGWGVFKNCKGLTSITIPTSVTSIGYEAFGWCENLTSITIPNSVTSIGDNAFCGCENLTSITIPNSVTSIGDNAFCGCKSLTSITIPTSVTSIGGSAFYGCKSLRSITIPDSVTEIGWRAFYGCSGLTSITIPNSVTSVGNSAFEGCESLRIHIEDLSFLPASYRGKAALAFLENMDAYSESARARYSQYVKRNAEKMMDLLICDPNLLEVVCREKWISAKIAPAFLQKAQETGDPQALAVMLEYIGTKLTAAEKQRAEKKKEAAEETAFNRLLARQGKEGIEGLTFAMSGSLKTFKNREEIKEYIVSQGGRLATSISANVDYLIMNKDASDSEKKKKAESLGIECITEYRFNDISGRAFQLEDGVLTNYLGAGGDVTIPAGVTSIGGKAFSGCESLTSITIPDSVTEIGWGAFRCCSNLTIHTPAGSYAETYAKENNIPFVAE